MRAQIIDGESVPRSLNVETEANDNAVVSPEQCELMRVGIADARREKVRIVTMPLETLQRIIWTIVKLRDPDAWKRELPAP